MWFHDLMGFDERSPEQVRENIFLDGEMLESRVNGKRYRCGRLETPSLGELRERVAAAGLPAGKLALRELVADAQSLHRDTANRGALIQVASQFNLLEMVGPERTPELGVGIYELDPTQGPACAVAAGAGTIYRNYFAEINGLRGQTTERQIDCLADIGAALGNDHERLWRMSNGYALATGDGLQKISRRLQSADESEIDELRKRLRIGLQWDAQVTISAREHTVSQAYCSALPIGYSSQPIELWRDFAGLVLTASYEATLAAGALNYLHTGNPTTYLTLIGGGVFGNEISWIVAAIERAAHLYSGIGLDVVIVSHGSSNPRVRELIGKVSG